MAIKKIIGIKTFKMGACGTNGTMGTTLAAVGHVVKDSAAFTTEDDEFFENKVEDYDFPVDMIPVNQGKIKFSIGFEDLDPATLVKLKGGTATGTTKWAAPADVIIIQQSVEIVTKNNSFSTNGAKIEIPKAQIKARFSLDLKNNVMGKVDCTIEALSPLDGSGVELSPFSITFL